LRFASGAGGISGPPDKDPFRLGGGVIQPIHDRNLSKLLRGNIRGTLQDLLLAMSQIETPTGLIGTSAARLK
jgi:hypothetical protein